MKKEVGIGKRDIVVTKIRERLGKNGENQRDKQTNINIMKLQK
jgi:hypothetical protein